MRMPLTSLCSSGITNSIISPEPPRLFLPSGWPSPAFTAGEPPSAILPCATLTKTINATQQATFMTAIPFHKNSDSAALEVRRTPVTRGVRLKSVPHACRSAPAGEIVNSDTHATHDGTLPIWLNHRSPEHSALFTHSDLRHRSHGDVGIVGSRTQHLRHSKLARRNRRLPPSPAGMQNAVRGAIPVCSSLPRPGPSEEIFRSTSSAKCPFR